MSVDARDTGTETHDERATVPNPAEQKSSETAHLITSYATPRSELLRFIPPHAQRVLDVGCYAGAFGELLKRDRDVEVWGVEPDTAASACAAQKLDHVVASGFDAAADVPNEYFDVVTFNDSLEHFPEPDAPLLLAKQKLRPGGVIICVIPNMRHIDTMIHLVMKRDWQYEPSGVRDTTHLRFFTRKSMARLFEKLGFVLVRQEGVNSFWWRPERMVSWAIVRFLPFWFGDMRYEQYVNVIKPR